MDEVATPQESRYRLAHRAWEAARHRPLDRHEQSLLYLVTADAGLWAWARPRLDAAEERVDLGGGAELNLAQRLLLDVARSLYGEEHLVNVAALAAVLDEHQFATVLTAVQAYRQDVDPVQAPHAQAHPAAAPLIMTPQREEGSILDHDAPSALDGGPSRSPGS